MILHCVFCALRPDHDPSLLAAVMADLAALAAEVPGMEWLGHGPNRDFETRSPGYPHGFVVRFRDRAALAAYDRLPAHRAAGARLVALCRGGGEGVAVYDLEVP